MMREHYTPTNHPSPWAAAALVVAIGCALAYTLFAYL